MQTQGQLGMYACPLCGQPLRAGEQMVQAPTGQVVHAYCWQQYAAQAQAQQPVQPQAQQPRQPHAQAQGGWGGFFVMRGQPVWAANPAVPPVARVLAYTFGGLMLITIAMALFGFRSLGGPTAPDKWFVFRSSKGFVTAYPEGWRPIPNEIVAKHMRNEGESPFERGSYPDLFMLRGAEGLSHVDIVVQQVPPQLNAPGLGDTTSLLLNAMDEQMMEGLGDPRRYGLSAVDIDAPAPARTLETPRTYRATSEQDHETVPFRSREVVIRGAWYYKRHRNQVMRIHGYAPEDDWPAMGSIVKEIGERVEWK